MGFLLSYIKHFYKYAHILERVSNRILNVLRLAKQRNCRAVHNYRSWSMPATVPTTRNDGMPTILGNIRFKGYEHTIQDCITGGTHRCHQREVGVVCGGSDNVSFVFCLFLESCYTHLLASG